MSIVRASIQDVSRRCRRRKRNIRTLEVEEEELDNVVAVAEHQVTVLVTGIQRGVRE